MRDRDGAMDPPADERRRAVLIVRLLVVRLRFIVPMRRVIAIFRRRRVYPRRRAKVQNVDKPPRLPAKAGQKQSVTAVAPDQLRPKNA